MKFLFFLLLTWSLIRPCSAAGFEHSVGIGLQHGGLVGYQLSNSFERGRIRGAIGIVGASIGYDHYMNDKISVGATYTESLRSINSVNLNYMPNGIKKSGWLFALDFAYLPKERAKGFFHTDETLTRIWLGVGYRF